MLSWDHVLLRGVVVTTHLNDYVCQQPHPIKRRKHLDVTRKRLPGEAPKANSICMYYILTAQLRIQHDAASACSDACMQCGVRVIRLVSEQESSAVHHAKTGCCCILY